jgi:RNase H-like domain found in reverse transcriptase
MCKTRRLSNLSTSSDASKVWDTCACFTQHGSFVASVPRRGRLVKAAAAIVLVVQSLEFGDEDAVCAAQICHFEEGHLIASRHREISLFAYRCVSRILRCGICADAYQKHGEHTDELRHEPLAFISGLLVRSSCNWSVPEKEAFAIVAALIRLRYLTLVRTFHVHTDHRNLRYIFHRRSPFSSTPHGKLTLAEENWSSTGSLSSWLTILTSSSLAIGSSRILSNELNFTSLPSAALPRNIFSSNTTEVDVRTLSSDPDSWRRYFPCPMCPRFVVHNFYPRPSWRWVSQPNTRSLLASGTFPKAAS